MVDDRELTAGARLALHVRADVVEARRFGSDGFMVRGLLRIGVGRRSAPAAEG